MKKIFITFIVLLSSFTIVFWLDNDPCYWDELYDICQEQRELEKEININDEDNFKIGLVNQILILEKELINIEEWTIKYLRKKIEIFNTSKLSIEYTITITKDNYCWKQLDCSLPIQKLINIYEEEIKNIDENIDKNYKTISNIIEQKKQKRK